MTTEAMIAGFAAQVERCRAVRPVGRVAGVSSGLIEVAGFGKSVRIGDGLRIRRDGLPDLPAEVVQLGDATLLALPEEVPDGVALGRRAILDFPCEIAPADHWLGRVIDPLGRPIDGRPLLAGPQARALRAAPPDPATRRPMGPRLRTGLAVTDTLLPIAKGQRVGLFAGSGVGKSSMLGTLARNVEADVVIIALVGERGRELRHFTEEVIGAEGLQRTVVVAATSDQSALQRRRCAWTAMAVAEHFRDQNKSVLLLADSITRFAEAHREVAVATGEAPVLRGFPPSTASMIMSLCERAGPGAEGQGNITAIFSVLVAGSDMEGPIADILRGVLDGHIVLDRAIAERGRFPAVDVLQSVSRSLPSAASVSENAMLSEARALLALYESNAVMIRAGLHTPGADAELDRAVAIWPRLDAFLGQDGTQDCAHSFQQLGLILRRTQASPPAASRPVREGPDTAETHR